MRFWIDIFTTQQLEIWLLIPIPEYFFKKNIPFPKLRAIRLDIKVPRPLGTITEMNENSKPF